MDSPKKPLSACATPIERLSASVGGNEVFVKREDLLPFSFGGNKARKARLFFREIEKGDYTHVVTYGAGSSNHCRVVANLAAAHGLACVIVSPEDGYRETANSRLVRLFGAEIVKTPLDAVSATIDRVLEELRTSGKPYFIAGGGHGNVGTEAYVEAYREIAAYEAECGETFDYIFLPSGTGTTQAGLVCGAALAGQGRRKILGMSIARSNPRGGEVVAESVRQYLAAVEFQGEIPAVCFDDSYILGGYGKYNGAVLETVRELMVKEGIPANTTYTGKAFWAMEQFLKAHKIKNKRVLFLHTGGAPLFFDDLGEL